MEPQQEFELIRDHFEVLKKNLGMPSGSLHEFKLIFLSLMQLTSMVVSLRTRVQEIVHSYLPSDYEVTLSRWSNKGMSWEERSLLRKLGTPTEVRIALDTATKLDGILEGCRILEQQARQYVALLQIEAKLSYVGHD